MKADFTPSFIEEKLLWDQGYSHVIGIDEVGRGAFAGPVVVAGVIFHPDCQTYLEEKVDELFMWFQLIHDSKLLTAKVREYLAPLIKKHCLFHAISEISVETINSIGIGKATFLGMQQVCKDLVAEVSCSRHPGFQVKPGMTKKNSKVAILVDAFTIPDVTLKQKGVIKGDQKSISIAAASIIAKVYRDEHMERIGKEHPEYVFMLNKGYGTKAHRDAIKVYGLSPLHRTNFSLQKYL